MTRRMTSEPRVCMLPIHNVFFARPDFKSSKKIFSHCLAHSILSAAPSFIMAACSAWSTPAQILGMLIGIAIFTSIAYAAHVRIVSLLVIRYRRLESAIHVAKSLRVIHCAIMLLQMAVFFTLTNGATFLLNGSYVTLWLDVLAGICANLLTVPLGLELDIRNLVLHPSPPQAILFAQATTATILEGFILALALGILSLVLWAILRWGAFFELRD